MFVVVYVAIILVIFIFAVGIYRNVCECVCVRAAELGVRTCVPCKIMYVVGWLVGRLVGWLVCVCVCVRVGMCGCVVCVCFYACALGDWCDVLGV